MDELRRVDQRVDDRDFLLTMMRPTPLRTTARTYGRDLHTWLRQFRGVALATLPLYVAWHEALAAVRHAPDPTRPWLDLWERALRDEARPKYTHG